MQATNSTTIGELIKNEVRKQEIPITNFADMIHCERNNVYNIFKRNNISIMQLKEISLALNHDFFKDISEDMNLITEKKETTEDKTNERALSQFFEVVPDILNEMGMDLPIIFVNSKNYKGSETCPIPDFMLAPYYITFSIGQTMNERIGENSQISIPVVTNEDGCEVEVSINHSNRTVDVNMKLDYKTRDEWRSTLHLAFDTYRRYNRI